MSSELITVALRIAAILGDLDVSYALGGSFASSIHGEPRASQDVDLVADLRPGHLPGLLSACEGEFFIDKGMVEKAIAHRNSFSLIHLPTSIKVDIFVAKDRALESEELRRREWTILDTDSEQKAYVATPEDIVLQKLEWFSKTRESSDRQWRDVLGVLKVRGESLDFEYLWKWADSIGVHKLLEEAIREAGIVTQDE